jgi:hypothetical protein
MTGIWAISVRTTLKQFEKLKRGLLSSIYRLQYNSWNVSHEKLLCNVETAGSSEIGSVKVQRVLCSQKLCFWYDVITLMCHYFTLLISHDFFLNPHSCTVVTYLFQHAITYNTGQNYLYLCLCLLQNKLYCTFVHIFMWKHSACNGLVTVAVYAYIVTCIL